MLALLLAIILATWVVELRADSPVDQQLQDLSDQIRTEEWEKASRSAEDLEKTWSKRRFWIALNNSVQDQQTFERTLTQVQAYVNSQDISNAAAYTALLKRMWYEFGR
jgi:hypothetical protein